MSGERSPGRAWVWTRTEELLSELKKVLFSTDLGRAFALCVCFDRGRGNTRMKRELKPQLNPNLESVCEDVCVYLSVRSENNLKCV